MGALVLANKSMSTALINAATATISDRDASIAFTEKANAALKSQDVMKEYQILDRSRHNFLRTEVKGGREVLILALTHGAFGGDFSEEDEVVLNELKLVRDLIEHPRPLEHAFDDEFLLRGIRKGVEIIRRFDFSPEVSRSAQIVSAVDDVELACNAISNGGA
ncbi:hypothetical protein TH19_10290 [Thalassospira profundimaris]|uniref:Uncharacterized protein n=1 Tax=Thalassospira profundimaris TaxID=502049 RepID=A0A367W6R8_9PROT|nr:hypothetical protein TH19_10290 [Thalassospira profundimaris]